MFYKPEYNATPEPLTEAESAELRMANILSEPAFAELLDYAIDVCISDRSLYDTNLAKIHAAWSDGPAQLPINPLGLRPALENETSLRSCNMTVESSHGSCTNISFLKNPEDFLPTGDRSTMERITAFGETVLDEAFAVLGADAEEKVEAIKATSSNEEEVKIINWLMRRINEIRKNKAATSLSEDEDSLYYHPARLSPKFMGTYPDIAVVPTCLGVSVLAAAFLHKAQIPYLHAGLVQGDADETRATLIETIEIALGRALADKMEVSPEVWHDLATFLREERQKLVNHRGHHAVVLAGFQPDKWGQIDPNYSSNYRLFSYDSKRLQKTYDTLVEQQYQLPGLEALTVLNAGIMARFFNVAAWDISKEPAWPESVSDLLNDCDTSDKVYERLTDYVVERLYQTKNMDQVEQNMQTMCKLQSKDPWYYMKEVVEQSIRDFVFPDAKAKDLAKSIKRFNSDEAYRQRRLADVCMLPRYVLIRLNLDYAEAVMDNWVRTVHTAFEVGLPAHRIGACILSDFAAHSEEDLPLSWWMAHWPSHVSFAEHARLNQSPAQDHLAKLTARYVGHQSLRYLSDGVIVDQFLEQGETPAPPVEGGEGNG